MIVVVEQDDGELAFYTGEEIDALGPSAVQWTHRAAIVKGGTA